MNMNSLLNSTTSPSSSSSQQISLHHNFNLDPTSSSSDFLDHMLSSSIPPPPWSDLTDSNDAGGGGFPGFDESTLLAAKLRQHQITPGGAALAKLMLQQQLLDGSPPFKSPSPGGEGSNSMQVLFNGFASGSQQNFHHSQAQNFGMMGQQQPQGSGSTSGCGSGAAAQQPKQRVRARRGQATDPHSIAERLRRERIAERMKSLQELVPNANKTDKASMLDEIIDYVKFLQLQVKVLSMSRLGGAAAVAPLVADMSSEKAGGDCIQAGNGGALPRNGTPSASSGGGDNLTITENQVAKLMEEDMGSAMQYLQGKGLCLMPISLATAISTVTCHARNPSINIFGNNNNNNANGDGPHSPNLSVLTVQSAAAGNGAGDGSAKDAASVSKP